MKINIGGILNRFGLCKNIIKKYGNVIEFYDAINMKWSGGRLNNDKKIEDLKPIVDFLANKNINFNLIASNYYIDLTDEISLQVLDYLKNFNNIGIILCNEQLYDFLKKNFNFKLKYSVTGFLDKKYEHSKLTDLESRYDTLCVRNEFLTDSNFLDIKDKSKYEVMLTKCGPSCDYWFDHFDAISRMNLKYNLPLKEATREELDRCLNCWYIKIKKEQKDLYNSLDYADWNEQDIKLFKSKGFTRFKIPGRERGHLEFMEYTERFIKWVLK